MRASVGFVVLCLSACQTTRHFEFDQAAPATLRHLTEGDVLGADAWSDSHAWLGIPFARPPVGARRWKKPERPEPWVGVRQALKAGPKCPQLAMDGSGTASGDEDCLTLNLWAPRLEPAQVGSSRLPVMVWIHGGGNSVGSATVQDGGRLASEQHVLVVAVQYRLGPLGWLRHAALREGAEAVEASGNFGTLDLVRALEWVHEHAAAFGGDPDNVTIFGESAGGFNVYSLLVAPGARGLFHRAIIESGYLGAATAQEAEAEPDAGGHVNSSSALLGRWLVNAGRAHSASEARALAASLGPAELSTFLQSLTPTQLLAGYQSGRSLGMLDAPLVFRDGVVLPEHEWLGLFEHPDQWNRVPVIAGTNRDESRLFLSFDPRHTWRLFGLIPRVRDEANYTATSDALSRSWKLGAVDQPLQAMARSGATELFAYRWDWRGESFGGLDVTFGAAHGLEVSFVFGDFEVSPFKPLFTPDTEESRQALSAQMRGLWGQFARSGDPGTPWARFDPTGNTHLRLDVGTAAMEPLLDASQRLLEEVLNDPRLPSPQNRCGVLRALVENTESLTADQYRAVTQCSQFPIR